MLSTSDIGTAALRVGRFLAQTLAAGFLPLGSVFSLPSLALALAAAVALVVAARWRRGRRARPRLILRALFPRRLFSRSGKADLGFFLFNTFAAGSLFGWALLSAGAVRGWTATGVSHALGPTPLGRTPGWASATVTTAALFAAYEFGYYVDHWLSHRVPALWEIHKPHHAAEALTPLTVFRVHPLESLKLANILAVVLGVTGGLCAALFGRGHEAALDGRNVLFLALWLAIGHLQHTNLWVTIPGPLGRVLISPAHHQIHHSADPRHFGKNLGNFLSVFDRMFGTLHPPTAARERLTFGVEGDGCDRHSVMGGLVEPVTGALRILRPSAAGPTSRRGAAPRVRVPPELPAA